MSYKEICACVSCERIFICDPEKKTRLCVFCDTPENNKLKWEGKLVMLPCEEEKKLLLVVNDGGIEIT